MYSCLPRLSRSIYDSNSEAYLTGVGPADRTGVVNPPKFGGGSPSLDLNKIERFAKVFFSFVQINCTTQLRGNQCFFKTG